MHGQRSKRRQIKLLTVIVSGEWKDIYWGACVFKGGFTFESTYYCLVYKENISSYYPNSGTKILKYICYINIVEHYRVIKICYKVYLLIWKKISNSVGGKVSKQYVLYI